ncbi:hypothetical protein BDR03DRAFT_974373 [Suillus americanus]|nr:hypothetical protein BDR03DRAFT_974373 [Suillus americanus]
MRAVLSGLASDLPSSLWDRPWRPHVVRAAQHRVGDHCHNVTVFGFLFYSLSVTVMACLISPACPFQTSTPTVLRMLGMHRVLLLIFVQDAQCSFHFPGPVRATGAFARHSLQLLSAALHKGLRPLVLRSSTNVVDSEAQPVDHDLDILAENDGTLTLDLLDTCAQPTARCFTRLAISVVQKMMNLDGFLLCGWLVRTPSPSSCSSLSL